MSFPKYIVGIVVVWITLYVTVYYTFLTPKQKRTSPHNADKHVVIDMSRGLTTTSNNPFYSDVCIEILKEQAAPVKNFGIVIPARNENPVLLLKTVRSIIKNSGSALLEIVIIDDLSENAIESWKEWKQSEFKQVTISFTRHFAHRGIAFSKNQGAQILTEKYLKTVPDLVVVFVDAHVIVTEQWLTPLYKSITNYPKAIVYPVIDVLTNKDSTDSGKVEYGVIKADNVVAGFDWSLHPKWEAVVSKDSDTAAGYDNVNNNNNNNGHRLKYTLTQETALSQDEIFSPSAPGIFAMKLAYLNELSGFDEQLFTSYYGQEQIELSIRTWLCGGVIIRQSCSRVAHYEKNLFQDSPVGTGVTQDMIDRNIMSIAVKWMDGFYSTTGSEKGSTPYKEVAYMSRFTNRVPYLVEMSHDPVLLMPPVKSFSQSEGLNNKLQSCLSFQWYLDNIYPGLVHDIESIENNYKAYLSSGYLEKALKNQYEQYNKASDVTLDSNVLDRLNKQQEMLADNPHHKRVFNEPNGKSKRNKKPKTREEYIDEHTKKIRDELECSDISFPVSISKDHGADLCSNPSHKCNSQKELMLFLCPKTCGYCDVTTGKFCEDFYLRKCVTWKEAGQCDSIDAEYGVIKDVCRKSCGVCTPKYIADSQSNSNNNNNNNGEQGNKDGQPVFNVGGGSSGNNNAIPPNPFENKLKPLQAPADPNEILQLTVDPFQLHQQYLNGEIDDRNLPHDNDCMFNGVPNGKILSRVQLAPSPAASSGVRIFCGIYTYEKNHDTNVKATRNTWAKKCDGFIAFSTKEDASIPSIDILHEGEESYDNMWQKSRSIWKYVHRHLRDKFDYFLLGGDDMFYIIENLRGYLNSPEIVTERERRPGLYIGRIFQPPKQLVFNSGGAGYILDQKSLDLLGEHIDKSECYPHQHGFWEDVNVANCLLKGSNGEIVPYDTRDPLERERFHPFTPGQHLTYQIPPKEPDWYAKYNPNLKLGLECCSFESISFHYVPVSLLMVMLIVCIDTMTGMSFMRVCVVFVDDVLYFCC